MQSLHLGTQTHPMLHDLLKSLDIKKASGLDEIPPRLVKAASDKLPVLLPYEWDIPRCCESSNGFSYRQKN